MGMADDPFRKEERAILRAAERPLPERLDQRRADPTLRASRP